MLRKLLLPMLLIAAFPSSFAQTHMPPQARAEYCYKIGYMAGVARQKALNGLTKQEFNAAVEALEQNTELPTQTRSDLIISVNEGFSSKLPPETIHQLVTEQCLARISI